MGGRGRFSERRIQMFKRRYFLEGGVYSGRVEYRCLKRGYILGGREGRRGRFWEGRI